MDSAEYFVKNKNQTFAHLLSFAFSLNHSTVVYLQCTQNARKFITSDKAFMRLPVPKPVTKKRKATVVADKDGWVDTNSKKKKKRVSTASPSSSSKKAISKKKKATKAKPKATATKPKTKTKAAKKSKSSTASTSKPKKLVKTKENEVIELIEDSDDDSSSGQLELVANTRKPRARRVSTTYAPLIADGPTDPNNFSDDDSDSEFEFE